LSEFNETKFIDRFVVIYSNIKFNENPSSGSRVVPCKRTHMTKQIVAFLNVENASTKEYQWGRVG